MYSNKKNVLQLAALLREYGIDHVVVSPGSRNAPIVQTLTQHPAFRCFTVVDERSAAFFALGLIEKLQRPVAVCCTSGTALLNFGSAVAEAFYQQLPLLVISADRPTAWIGQMDGQTLPQPGVFNTMVKKSVQLPEPITKEDEWYCNRLINEALLELTHHGNGPVQINVPLSEPLFEFTEKELPQIRAIRYSGGYPKSLDNSDYFRKQWAQSSKRMVIVGQLLPDEKVKKVLEEVAKEWDCVILAEHTANVSSCPIIDNFDQIIYALPTEKWDEFAPDLLITFGGHVVSKRMKQFLRKQHPARHWHLSADGSVPDLFQSLTDIIEMDENFFALLGSPTDQQATSYNLIWKSESDKLKNRSKEYTATMPFSDLLVLKTLFPLLPEKAALQLGNSSTVRNAQLFDLNPEIPVFCNRGTSGIDGSMSTAVGFAAIHLALTFLVIGDLSFFYDVNGLWNKHINKNLRILLVNNGGGEIFHLLPGLNKAESLDEHISYRHNTGAKEWAMAMGFLYLSAENGTELKENIITFVSNTSEKPILLETKTSMEINAEVFKAYYHNLK
ncbi:2-succinyl-5-enolpyruvyl-6-hydroxy-3-cyclohexene-1-carboxylic-acid synthase [uncultured Bacteroides sp.]|uniref:2-succinyl-5-enolpyruvyl-6-hydroxy-3- cyclohexene-1-carboxylic-acid synthase n=1 Tax=uncultured Bacteroides sp. TaxID=162156 RepID=UPI002AABED2A|nr:2-succinyl-5-enolpyruvyl-6-hydroxy-3-cyclohexene-1-carboxylic-acid synthase [uncultured Bacteroides sp.]